MKINNVNNQPILPASKKNIPAKDEKKGQGVDSINISPEARELINSEQTAKLNEIRQKLSENFYSRKEVLEKTAEAILKELKG
ncbi:MAG: hypothetical protein QY331_02845 [Melioribacteraceae bacterium]|jgi:hypothetical protein|nr:hypothetical protein [Melioribacteraceae bacterium]RJP56723.1 MAG: hypothetical protein C4543_10925 [Ignavibacteriales bacterium]WKZ70193.1 MAG: hypothetical protein QY331_02845 [Melioribacteraceae bacterium]